MRRKSTATRQLLHLVALLGIVLIVAACTAAPPAAVEAPAAAEGAAEEAEPAVPIEGSIRVLTVGDPWQFSLEKIAPLYTEQTGIEVQIESLGYDALQARLVGSFISGAPDADVITVDQMWTGQYFDNGWVMPLDDFVVADEEINLTDFIPEVLYSMNTWRGQLITLPIAAYGQGVMYRPDVFEALGLDTPPKTTDPAWTWDAYLETLQAIDGQTVDDTEYHGTVIVGSQPVPIVHMFTQIAANSDARWFQQFPEAPWDFEPMIESDANVAAVEYYKQLYDLSPPESINYNWFEAGTRFSEGDIGMFYWWTPYFYLVNNAGYMTGDPSVVRGNFETAALPVGSEEQTVSIGGWSLGIPSTSADPQAAYDFIAWATGEEAQRAMGLLPDFGYQFSDFARTSLYEDEELQAIYPHLEVQHDLMTQGNGKISRPPMPAYSTLEGIYGLKLNEVLTGKPADEAMAETAVLWRNILTGNFLIPYNLESYNDTLESTEELIETLSN